jgi:hypothetical protein
VVASALLAIAGADKVVRPEPTLGALRSVGLRARGGVIVARVLGAVEVAIGATAIGLGGRMPAALVGLAYLGFAGFVAVALRRGGAVSSCGCFGAEDTPPTAVHLVLDLLAAGLAGAAAVWPVGGLPEVIAEQSALGVPFLAMVALATWFAYLALSVLPGVAPRERRS